MRLIHAAPLGGNFGDDLNPALWREVFPDLETVGDETAGFAGVGTIIGLPCPGVERVHVFSSGVGYDALSDWSGKRVTYWCVRGAVSAWTLGLDRDKAVADGAYVCPVTDVFAPPARSARRGTLVIPHVDSIRHDGWAETCEQLGFGLLDARCPPAEAIGAIASAERVLTESLHGAIIADAYGTPWTAFGCSKNFSTMKWADWFSSLELRPSVASIPPPTASIAAKHGRHRGRLEADVAAHLTRLSTPGDPLRESGAPDQASASSTRIKVRLASLPGIGAALGFSPGRTAEALAVAAGAEPQLSSRDQVARLQQRLIERAKAFAAAAGVRLSGSFGG